MTNMPDQKPDKTFHAAMPNPLFPPEITVLVRFVKYANAVECPLCKKKSRTHWTMLCPFQAAHFGSYELRMDPRIFQPGESVCSDHPIDPIEAVRQMFCYPSGKWWKGLGDIFDEACDKHEAASEPQKEIQHQ